MCGLCRVSFRSLKSLPENFLPCAICCQKTDVKAPVVILYHEMVLKIEDTHNA